MKELSDETIKKIHNGLLIPNDEAIRNMARELLKRRGFKDPDAI